MIIGINITHFFVFYSLTGLFGISAREEIIDEITLNIKVSDEKLHSKLHKSEVSPPSVEGDTDVGLSGSGAVPEDHREHLIQGKSNTSSCSIIKSMVRYKGANQYGGARLKTKSSEESCQQLCLDSPECAAVDYHKLQGSCWMHSDVTSQSHDNSSCCNHYKKLDVCKFPCFQIYRGYTLFDHLGNVSMWQDATVNKCKRICTYEDHCQGFVYDKSSQECAYFYNISEPSTEDEWPDRLNISDKHDTWIRSSCIGHDKDKIISVETTTKVGPEVFDRGLEAAPTPIIVDFGGNLDESKKASDLSTPVIILIIGAVVIVMIALASICVFMYQRKKCKRKSNHIPNPSSPQHWINTCLPSHVTHAQSKCDHCHGSGITRLHCHDNHHNDEALISLDTFPLSHQRKATLLSTQTPGSNPITNHLSLPGAPRMFSKILPRPHVYCPHAVPYTVDCYDNYTGNPILSRSLPSPYPGDYGLCGCLETHVQPGSTPPPLYKQGTGKPVDDTKVQRTTSKRLTRYNLATVGSDVFPYVAEFGNTDKFYKGSNE